MTAENTIARDARALPVVDVEAELRRFEQGERARLGLDGRVEHWVERMAKVSFTRKERSSVTLLVGGLTRAQDAFVRAALEGIGYDVRCLDVPDVAALQVGKEFGNRGQCNPTYFTVGNLVKHLQGLRDAGMTEDEIVRRFVFVTAGACGPCRFGMYVTEYRKALRDAGFDGFRVMLFQQTGGLSQATGEDSGLEMNPEFFLAILRAIVAGDVLNALSYRIRPYEKQPGATDAAREHCIRLVSEALRTKRSVLVALRRARRAFAAIEVDRTRVKPKVSIIGEFWAMTTEGDGNYQLQRFLEREGAECDVQLVTAWVLYNLWEARHDTLEREALRGEDGGRYGLAGLGRLGVAKRMLAVRAAEVALRGAFQAFARAIGLQGYTLPDMEEVARVSHDHYDVALRGGEGHMEVGKLILNVVHAKAHMTLSVKPFGCMPSASVSDGVQSAVAERHPGAIFCAVETSGDGAVNFQSRVQMMLFKAKQAAEAEYERACAERGVTRQEVAARLARSPRVASALHKPPHVYAGSSADFVAEVAPSPARVPARRAEPLAAE